MSTLSAKLADAKQQLSEHAEGTSETRIELQNVVTVLEQIDQLAGEAKKQAINCYQYEFALEGRVYVGFPASNQELISAAPSVGLQLVNRQGQPL
jgi:hypothetical protein